MKNITLRFPHKTRTIADVCDYIKTSLDEGKVSITSITGAPKWLQILSRGSYCSYKNTVYVPTFHSMLVESEKEEDKNVSTAKLCPLFALQMDTNNNVSFFTAIKYLYFLNYQILYFLYEFFFLKTTNNRLLDLICLGFMSTRRYLFIRLTPEQTKNLLQQALNNKA